VVPHESLAQALKTELEAAGHPVRVVQLPWIDKGGLATPELQRLGAGHDRVLAVNASQVGFMTDGVTGNYFPLVRARFSLYGADRNQLLYDGHHTTGPVKSGEGWTQLPLVGPGFRSYEALTAQPALTAGAMREALALVARSAVRDLQGAAGAARPVVATGQPTPPAVAALAGEWSGTVRCGAFQGNGRVDNPDGWQVPARMTLSGGAATVVRGNAQYTETLNGQVEADLQLVLSGHGAMHATPDLRWATQFAGRFAPDHAQFGGKGTLVDRQGRLMRHCTIELQRGRSRPA
jgi:hypothetical protein